jgi:hypothetical protein
VSYWGATATVRAAASTLAGDTAAGVAGGGGGIAGAQPNSESRTTYGDSRTIMRLAPTRLRK